MPQPPGLIASKIGSLILRCARLAHWFGAPQLPAGLTAGLALARLFLPLGAALATVVARCQR
ncbi:MAG: hypothetical protein AAGG11_20475 [Pseudomonadota bacterium]